MSDIHLWDIDHPYYCTDENYFTTHDKSVFTYEEWRDFFVEHGESDMDLNLIFRWDWVDMSDKDNWADDNPPAVAFGKDELHLYVMHQRKGRFVTWIVYVSRDEEQQVIDYLRPRYEHLLKLWQPFAPAAPSNEE